jgi:hypothetical protein
MRIVWRAVALLAVLSASALAESQLEPPELSLYRRWGPFRVRPGLRLSNVGYDNNIFIDNTDPVGDFRATLSPRIDGLVLFGNTAYLTFDETLAYTAYATNTDQNFLDQFGDARLMFPLGNVGIYADAIFNVVHQRQIDREDLRPRRTEEGLGAGAIFELGWRTEVELSQHRVRYRYTDPDDPDIGARLDRDEGITALQASYHLRGRTRLLFDVGYADFNFVGGELQGPNDPEKDSVQVDLLVGVRFGEGGPLVGKARIGAARVDFKNPTTVDLREPIGDLEFIYRVDSRTRLKLLGERTIEFAVFGGQTHYVLGTVGVEGLRWVSRFIGAEAGVGLGRLTFPDTELVTSRRIDEQVDYFAGLRLRLSENSLGKRVEYTLRFTGYRRTSTVQAFDFERNTLSFGAVYGY